VVERVGAEVLSDPTQGLDRVLKGRPNASSLDGRWIERNSHELFPRLAIGIELTGSLRSVRIERLGRGPYANDRRVERHALVAALFAFAMPVSAETADAHSTGYRAPSESSNNSFCTLLHLAWLSRS
jgi:hypothetical protein